jgi:putative peptidoglycan lipid II flippase
MQDKSEVKYVATQALFLVSLLSLLGPASGLVLEAGLAWRFGASATMDAFRISMVILLLANQFFFGSLLPNVLIPVMEGIKQRDGDLKTWQFSFTVAVILTALTVMLAAYCFFYSENLIRFLGPGLSGQAFDDAIFLVKWFGCISVLILWSGVLSSSLNLYRVFWLTPTVRLIPNLFIVSFILMLGREFDVYSLVIGFFFAHLCIVLLFVFVSIDTIKKLGLKVSACLRFRASAELRSAGGNAIPICIMILISVLGDVVVSREFSLMDPGTVSIFGYSWKLLALIGLIPSGLLIIVLPYLSEAATRRDMPRLMYLMSRAVRFTVLVTVSTTGFVLIQSPLIVDLLLGHGEMEIESVVKVSEFFRIIVLSTTGAALYALTAKLFFSLGDTVTPMIVSFLSAAMIVFFAPLSADIGGAVGVAWTLNVVAYIGFFLLFSCQIYRYGMASLSGEIVFVAKIVIITSISSVIIYFLRSVWQPDYPSTVFNTSFYLLFMGVVYCASGLMLCLLLGLNEAREILIYMRWQLRKIRSGFDKQKYLE